MKFVILSPFVGRRTPAMSGTEMLLRSFSAINQILPFADRIQSTGRKANAKRRYLNITGGPSPNRRAQDDKLREEPG